MGNGSILHKLPPVRKPRSGKFFPSSLFRSNTPTHPYPSIACFVHAGTRARHILDELKARAENIGAEQKQSSGNGLKDDT